MQQLFLNYFPDHSDQEIKKGKFHNGKMFSITLIRPLFSSSNWNRHSVKKIVW